MTLVDRERRNPQKLTLQQARRTVLEGVREKVHAGFIEGYLIDAEFTNLRFFTFLKIARREWRKVAENFPLEE